LYDVHGRGGVSSTYVLPEANRGGPAYPNLPPQPAATTARLISAALATTAFIA
jgi:hypothetical protein